MSIFQLKNYSIVVQFLQTKKLFQGKIPERVLVFQNRILSLADLLLPEHLCQPLGAGCQMAAVGAER